MRIIEACNSAIRTVAVSPDGRYVAASSASAIGVFHWTSGHGLYWKTQTIEETPQIAFTADGYAVYCAGRTLCFVRLHSDAPESRHPGPGEWYAGGVAASPDGKMLVAVVDGEPKHTKLARWSLPSMRVLSGYDDWWPFRKIAFSPNGQFLAGIWPGMQRQWNSLPALFELRFAASGGVDCRYPPMGTRTHKSTGFVSFTRDSGTCAFGWENEFHVLDISTGTSLAGNLRRVEATFRDAFTGSGQHFATVDDAGMMKVWDPKSWQVMREYDWGCGPLTCVAFTADGLAGVCGTTDGRLVQFDVDE